MLFCLGELGKAAKSFGGGDDEAGKRHLASVVNCPGKDTCATRHVCATAAMGVIRKLVAETDRQPAA
ncbi:MAG: hypothetical protein ACM31L_05900 [Actinomycetota bacterium]